MSNYCRIVSSNPVFLSPERKTSENFEQEYPDSIFEVDFERNYLELEDYQVNSWDWLVPEFEEIISWLADGSWFVLQSEDDIFVSLFVKDRKIHCEDYEFTSPFDSNGSTFWEG